MLTAQFIMTCGAVSHQNPIFDRDRTVYFSNKQNSEIYSVVDSMGATVKHIHRWLRSLNLEVGVSIVRDTVKQYGRAITYFVRWVEEDKFYPTLTIDQVLEVLTRQDIKAWIMHMSAQGLNPSTIRFREVSLKIFITWLATNDGGNIRESEKSPYGRDSDNQLKYISRSGSKKSPKYIDTELVISVISNFHNECERCMFHMQYDTGLRISEVINLRSRDLPDAKLYPPNIEFIPLVIQGVKGRGGQSKERITLISKAVLNRVKRYHSSIEYKMSLDWDMTDPDKPVFLTSNRLTWKYRNAKEQFDAALNRIGLNKQFQNHWLRHGTAFSVLKSDIGRGYEDRILAVQQMLGHSHLSTTEIYTQISPALLASLTKKGQEINRADEAERIRNDTYLAPLKHKEKRGHKK